MLTWDACIEQPKQTRDTPFTGKIPGKKLTSNVHKVVGFHHTKWLISWILPWADLWWSHRQDWDSHIQSVRQHYVWTWRQDTHIAVGLIHVATISYIEGTLTTKKKNDQMSNMLGNNCVAFMFDEIRYELNGVDIDRNGNEELSSRTMCQWRTTKLWLPWTQDRTLNPIRRKDILIFVCRSTCYWAFARIANAWSSTFATNWFWYELATITIAWWKIL